MNSIKQDVLEDGGELTPRENMFKSGRKLIFNLLIHFINVHTGNGPHSESDLDALKSYHRHVKTGAVMYRHAEPFFDGTCSGAFAAAPTIGGGGRWDASLHAIRWAEHPSHAPSV
jgi:hypothetical protein